MGTAQTRTPPHRAAAILPAIDGSHFQNQRAAHRFSSSRNLSEIQAIKRAIQEWFKFSPRIQATRIYTLSNLMKRIRNDHPVVLMVL
jgi:hypothetical protein